MGYRMIMKEYLVDSIGSLLRTHCVEVSNAEKANIGSVDVINHLHIAKHARISAVIDVMT